MITRPGVTNRTEVYRGFTVSWQEPPQWAAMWVANIGSEERHLLLLMDGVKVIDGGTRDEMIVSAKKYIDSLLG